MTTIEPTTVLEARHLSRHFTQRSTAGWFGAKRVNRAVDDVSLHLDTGRVTAVVGESGSGKSVLARMLARIVTPTSGDAVPGLNRRLQTESTAPIWNLRDSTKAISCHREYLLVARELKDLAAEAAALIALGQHDDHETIAGLLFYTTRLLPFPQLNDEKSKAQNCSIWVRRIKALETKRLRFPICCVPIILRAN